MKLRKRIALLLVLAQVAVCPLTADAMTSERSSGFHSSFISEGLLLGGGLAINAGAMLIEKKMEPIDGWTMDSKRDLSEINAFDRPWAFPFSQPMDFTSEVLSFSALLAPSLLLAAPMDDWFTLGLIYSESLIWAWGIKELGKNLFHRYRPYTYFEGYTEEALADGDFQQSFPSGHTTLAFTGAGFSIYLINHYFKDSSWRIPLIASTSTLAVGAAVFRVASGNHFLTDVLAGAAIGIFTGFFIPWLHTFPNDTMSISVQPSEISFLFSY